MPRLRLVALTCGLLLLPAPAPAAMLTIVSGQLDLSQAFPNQFLFPATVPTPIALNGPVNVMVSDADGSFVLPAGSFGPVTTVFTKGLTTGVAQIEKVTLAGVGNGALAFGGAGTGTGALQGSIFLNVLQIFDLTIPLSVVGVPGASAQAGSGAIILSLFAQGWTSGAAVVPGVTVTTPSGGFASTVTLSGSDARTPSFQGSLTLVSGFRTISNTFNAQPGFAIVTLQFVPEPERGSLLLAGALAATAFGLHRRRR